MNCNFPELYYKHYPVRQRAFTLVELIVVVAIMGMGLSLFLGINYRQREAFRWRTNLREIQVFLKVARSYAVLERRSNSCSFNFKTRTFSEKLRGRKVVLTAAAELKLSAEQQVELDALDQDQSAAETDSDSDKPDAELVLITFFADGGAAGGALEVASGRRNAVLAVDALTGAIELSEQVADAGTE
ncbi:MAG: hypothetical protein DRH03_12125 [Deltaproteobacteria bacterium]|nr:MAG: hypothetical protein DRH03_12125 [Deltaproteobacteria bacterium]